MLRDLADIRHREGQSDDQIAEYLEATLDEVRSWIQEANAQRIKLGDPFPNYCAVDGQYIPPGIERERQGDRYYHVECARRFMSGAKHIGMGFRRQSYARAREDLIAVETGCHQQLAQGGVFKLPVHDKQGRGEGRKRRDRFRGSCVAPESPGSRDAAPLEGAGSVPGRFRQNRAGKGMGDGGSTGEKGSAPWRSQPTSSTFLRIRRSRRILKRLSAF
jgi:hypothetical protein